MTLRYQDVESLFLVLFILAAVLLERKFPARKSLNNEIKLNLVGLLAIVVFVNVSRLSLSSLSAQLPEVSPNVHEWPSWAKIIATIFIVDFCLYWIHRGMHEVPALWRTHVWHHTTSHVNWLAGFRTSFVHAFLFAIPQIFVPFYIFKFTFTEAAIAFSFAAFMQIFAHSNIDISSDFVNRWFGTPTSHRLHHARMRKLHDSNYGIFLLIWDHMFGTYQSAKNLSSKDSLGVDLPKNLFRTLWGV